MMNVNTNVLFFHHIIQRTTRTVKFVLHLVLCCGWQHHRNPVRNRRIEISWQELHGIVPHFIKRWPTKTNLIQLDRPVSTYLIQLIEPNSVSHLINLRKRHIHQDELANWMTSLFPMISLWWLWHFFFFPDFSEIII